MLLRAAHRAEEGGIRRTESTIGTESAKANAVPRPGCYPEGQERSAASCAYAVEILGTEAAPRPSRR